MAVPKHRVSKTAKRKRRTHFKLSEVATTSCTNCNAVIKPHHVCPECGFYKGSKVIDVKVKD